MQTVLRPVVGDLFRYFNPVPLNPINYEDLWLVLTVQDMERGSIKVDCLNMKTGKVYYFDMYPEHYAGKFILLSRLP